MIQNTIHRPTHAQKHPIDKMSVPGNRLFLEGKGVGLQQVCLVMSLIFHFYKKNIKQMYESIRNE